jgi:hypothetical protein
MRHGYVFSTVLAAPVCVVRGYFLLPQARTLCALLSRSVIPFGSCAEHSPVVSGEYCNERKNGNHSSQMWSDDHDDCNIECNLDSLQLQQDSRKSMVPETCIEYTNVKKRKSRRILPIAHQIVPTSIDLRKARRVASRVRATKACSFCSLARTKCSHFRPCVRCQKIGKADACASEVQVLACMLLIHDISSF